MTIIVTLSKKISTDGYLNAITTHDSIVVIIYIPSSGPAVIVLV